MFRTPIFICLTLLVMLISVCAPLVSPSPPMPSNPLPTNIPPITGIAVVQSVDVQNLESSPLQANASKGNLEAFNHLVLTYQNMVFQHAWAMLNDRDLAQDVTRESLTKAFQALGCFRGGSFHAWLLRIVTNTSYDLLRRSQRHPMQPLVPENDDGDEIESPFWLVDPSASVQNTMEQNEETRHIYRMFK